MFKDFIDLYGKMKNNKMKSEKTLYFCQNDGFMSCWFDQDLFVIHYISVIKPHRRRGKLTRFINYLVKQGQRFIISGVGTKEMDCFCKKMVFKDSRFVYQGGDLLFSNGNTN